MVLQEPGKLNIEEVGDIGRVWSTSKRSSGIDITEDCLEIGLLFSSGTIPRECCRCSTKGLVDFWVAMFGVEDCREIANTRLVGGGGGGSVGRLSKVRVSIARSSGTVVIDPWRTIGPGVDPGRCRANPVGEVARPFRCSFGISNGLDGRVGESGELVADEAFVSDFCELKFKAFGRLGTVGDEVDFKRL